MSEKQEQRSKDSKNIRGLTTDQRIIMEGLYIYKKAQKQMEHEAAIVGPIAYENTINRQIESTEKRKTLQCPKYLKK